MKKTTVILFAAALLTASVPAMAMTHLDGKAHDEKCQKECDMFLKNCGNEVDTLQQRIQKLESALRNNAGKYSVEESRKLQGSLEDAQRTLADISRGGA